MTNGIAKPADRLHGNTMQLIARTQQLLNRSTELCERMRDLKDQISRAIRLTSVQVDRNVKNSRITFVKPSQPSEAEPVIKSSALAS
jgi:hypothetical protein